MRNEIRLSIDLIRIDGDTQSRASLNESQVSDYADDILEGATFPAVTVFYDGAEYWMADGFHRLAAHKMAGLSEILAYVVSGDVRDARLYGAQANQGHGLRRSAADKRNAVMTYMNDPEWTLWPDRKIARQVGVSHTFVSGIRAKLAGNVASERHSSAIQASDIEADPMLPDQPEGAPLEAEGSSDEPVSREEAKLRQEFQRFTPVGQEDAYVALRMDLAEAKAALRKSDKTIRELSARNAEMAADDKNAELVRMQGEVKRSSDARWKAQEDLNVANAHIKHLKKRIKELESIEIAL